MEATAAVVRSKLFSAIQMYMLAEQVRLPRLANLSVICTCLAGQAASRSGGAHSSAAILLQESLHWRQECVARLSSLKLICTVWLLDAEGPTFQQLASHLGGTPREMIPGLSAKNLAG